MILEAFSVTLRQEWKLGEQPAKSILHRWLLKNLTEANPQDHVTKVIQTELKLLHLPQHQLGYIAKSPTGQTLLKSLYQYCDSYEQWQFSRWLHELKPQSFKQHHP